MRFPLRWLSSVFVVLLVVLTGCTLSETKYVRAINEMPWPMLVEVDGMSHVVGSGRERAFAIEWDYPIGPYAWFESDTHTARGFARPANFESSTIWTHRAEITLEVDSTNNFYDWRIRPDDAVYE